MKRRKVPEPLIMAAGAIVLFSIMIGWAALATSYMGKNDTIAGLILAAPFIAVVLVAFGWHVANLALDIRDSFRRKDRNPEEPKRRTAYR